MSGQRAGVIELHMHRSALVGNPDQRLKTLLHEVLEKVYNNNLMAMADDYTAEKTAETVRQMLNKQFIDRAELYEHLLRWAIRKLQEVRTI